MSSSTLILAFVLLRPAPQVPAFEDDTAFQGTWLLISDHTGATPNDLLDRRMRIRDGVWSEWQGGTWYELEVKRSPAAPWPIFDCERFGRPRSSKRRGGGVASGNASFRRRGVYRLDGDTLTFAFQTQDEPLPENFESKENRSVQVWRRVRTR